PWQNSTAVRSTLPFSATVSSSPASFSSHRKDARWAMSTPWANQREGCLQRTTHDGRAGCMQFLLCYSRISPTVNTLGDSSQPVRLVSRIDEALSPHARAVMQIAGIEWLRKSDLSISCVQILLPTS